MKIFFTGGGTGGHFYPIIAIVEAVHDLEQKERFLPSDIFFVSNDPYDNELLFNNNITYIEIKTGKRRAYASARNTVDLFVTAKAVIQAIFLLYKHYPDVVFGKGGYSSYPTLFAARLLRIPVVIHESDAVPGRVNKWAGKFARYIAVSYPDAVKYFPEDKTVVTGNPIRREIIMPITQGSVKFLELEENVPVILVLGGSQGSQIINEVILDVLPTLLEKYQIIHQVGENNKKDVEARLPAVLDKCEHKNRYKMYTYLNNLALRMSAGVANLVISRAGSTIFEIASWKKPSIIIPITNSVGDHQRQNAFHYARDNAALVIVEENLTPLLLNAEIERIMGDPQMRANMCAAAGKFAERNTTAAEKIARQLLRIGLGHE